MGFFIYTGIYSMDNEKIKKSVEKYVDAIIVPKFPDIMKISVEIIPAKWSGLVPADTIIKIVFFMDGIEWEVEGEIEENIWDMFKMFSFGNDIRYKLEFETS